MTKRAERINQNYVFRVIRPSNKTSGFNISQYRCNLQFTFDMSLESITKLNHNYLAASNCDGKPIWLALLGHKFDVVEYREIKSGVQYTDMPQDFHECGRQ